MCWSWYNPIPGIPATCTDHSTLAVQKLLVDSAGPVAGEVHNILCTGQYIPIILKAAVGLTIRKLKVFPNRYLLFQYTADNSIIRIFVSTITLNVVHPVQQLPSAITLCYIITLFFLPIHMSCVTFAIVCVYTERLQGDVQQNKLSSGANCILIALS